MNRINIKAVILGIAADIGGSILSGGLLLSLFAGNRLSGEISAEDMENVLKQALQNTSYLVSSFVVGLLFSVLGGYVAARVAKKEIFVNAGVVGVFGLLLGLLGFSSDYPVWFNVGGILLVIPASLYGARLAESRLAR